MEKREFNYTFQINKTVIFEVSYYTLGTNKSPYFSTSAAVFNRLKSDFNQCGQCQEDLLFGDAKKFFYKFDSLHLKDLSENDYISIIEDIELLKAKYNYIDNCSFYNQRELSKMKLKA